MARAALTGTRLRERRLALGLRQADVAAAVGVSAPYLNLIEHNRRRVSPLLLESLADHLGVAAEALEDGAEGAQIEELRAAATALPGSGAELDRAEEFAGRFPGWAALARGLARRAAGLERAVEALNDRMTHDPHLSDSLHEVLSAVASVRSTAAILAETEDIEPEWRMRFLKNLHGDSERLALGAEALVAFLDGSDRAEAQVMIAPQEEVEAWLAARGWHLAELEPGGPGSAVLEGEVAGLASVAARRLARDWMQVMARDAARVPLETLETEADPVRLAAALGVEVTVVLRRMALAPGSEAGLALCDASGALVLRKPAEGFAFPRFGSACPLWPLYAALGRTGSPVVADLVVAGRGGRRFRAIAHCAIRHPEGLGGVELREAAMLVQPLRGSVALVGDITGAQVVGSSCRVCARGDCPARREPSILTDASMG